MRFEVEAEALAEGGHRRSWDGIGTASVSDHDRGVVDHATLCGALHVGDRLDQEGPTLESRPSDVHLRKKDAAVAQHQRSALHQAPLATDDDTVRRSVVLHFFAWLEVIATRPPFARLADLVAPAKRRQARVPHLDSLGEQLLAYAHEVALAPSVQRPNLVEVLAELLVTLQALYLGDATT